MMNMKRHRAALFTGGAALLIAATIIAFAQSSGGQSTDTSKEWPTYGHDAGGMRFSPLTQLTPANVGNLKVAWVYHMKPAGGPAPVAPPTVDPESEAPGGGRGGRGGGFLGGSGFRPSETTPLVVDGVMYLSTPYSRVVAVDPTSGKEIWAFQLPTGNPATRGVEYWPGSGQTPAQIVFGSSDGKLYSINAKTGTPNKAFGDNGIVNMNTPEIMQGLPGR